MIVSNSEKVGLKEFQYNNDRPVSQSTSQDGRFICFHHLACPIILYFSHHQESKPSPYSFKEREREEKQINNNKNVYSSSARDSGANVVVDEPACRDIMLMDLSTVQT